MLYIVFEKAPQIHHKTGGASSKRPQSYCKIYTIAFLAG